MKILGFFKKGKGLFGRNNNQTTKDDILIVNSVESTQELINNGADGVNPFISALDLVTGGTDGIISGNGIVWIENYDYLGSAYVWVKKGVTYSSGVTPITLDPANPDAGINRTDQIVLAFDIAGNGFMKVKKGVEGAVAVDPVVNEETEIFLVNIDVNGATTQPANITELILYDEDETVLDANGASVIGTAANPYSGTKCIEATDFTTGQSFYVKQLTDFNASLKENFIFQIASTSGKWKNFGTIKLALVDVSNNIISNIITIDSSLTNTAGNPFAFNSKSNTWQTISIPTLVLNATSEVARGIIVFKDDNRGTDSFKLDLIRLQQGVVSPVIFIKTKLSEFINDGNGDINLPFITEEDIPAGINPTGLEALDEGDGIGWRLIGRDPTNHGIIGEHSIDATLSNAASTTMGVTGKWSAGFGEDNTLSGSNGFVAGFNNVVAGNGTAVFGEANNVSNTFGAAFGNNNTLSGHTSIVFGTNNTVSNTLGASFGGYNIVSGYSSFSAGYLNNVSGSYTTSIGARNEHIGWYGLSAGLGLINKSTSTIVIGQSNLDYTNTSGSINVSTAPLFVIGNGTVLSSNPNTVNTRSNAMVVLQSGEITAPSLTTTIIDTEATGKVLTTKEWIIAQGFGSTSGFVPYTGATGNVDLGAWNISAAKFNDLELFSTADNIGIGTDALQDPTIIDSVALGHYASQFDDGHQGVSIGNYAKMYGTNSDNIAIGFACQFANTDAQNVAIGSYAMNFNDGYQNTAIGHNAWANFIPDTANAKNVANNATDIDFSTDIITIAAHGFGNSNRYYNLKYTTTGTPIAGLANGQTYLVELLTTNTFKIAFKNITSIGTGVHTFTPQLIYDNTTVIGANSEPSKSNQVKLGDDSVIEVYTKGTYVSGGYTVATLPTGVTGARTHVTDATATTFYSIVAGGGGNTVPVFYNGTNWVIA